MKKTLNEMIEILDRINNAIYIEDIINFYEEYSIKLLLIQLQITKIQKRIRKARQGGTLKSYLDWSNDLKL